MKRGRVGDNNAHLGSEAQSLESRPFPLQVFPGEVEPHFMSLQEAIELVASLKAEKLAQLRLGEPARLELFQRKSFEGAAGKIAPRGGEALSDIIGDVEGEFHGRSLTRERGLEVG